MTTKTTCLTAIIAIAVIIFTGCYDSRCIDGNYHLKTENRASGPFYEITSNGDFVVNVYKSPNFDIEIEAEENLLPYIETDVHGSTLTISTRNARCFRNNYPVVINVYAPDIESINLNGSGSITCDTMNSNSANIRLSGSGVIVAGCWNRYLDANISGSGDIYLNGRIRESDLMISGSGEIRSENLQQDSCYSTISGSGDMFVWVNDLLDVKITGSGVVTYKGTPVVKTTITGSGKVVNY